MICLLAACRDNIGNSSQHSHVFLQCGDSEGEGVCTWWPRGKGAKDRKETRVALGTK
jgi:hypothetical protein